ncbi:MAG: K(+)-transporting ATPase subunit C [Ignavibacteriae bacterium]|nr:K(+)-transporting ATPase subunit C [Ignavibacteriota bacterium]
MKTNLLPALKLTLVSLLFFSGLYTIVIWGIACLTPNGGNAQVITVNNKKYYSNIGQSFTDDKYFNSRPSAVGYNAAGSGGSNKGPSNPEYLVQVKARIDTFLVHNPDVKKAEIPSELVTSSGSGLDPHISPEAAFVQIKRIAMVRNMSEDKLITLVTKNIEKPLLGLFGTNTVNVLKLNIDLENAK